jgi:hypothetical protein
VAWDAIQGLLVPKQERKLSQSGPSTLACCSSRTILETTFTHWCGFTHDGSHTASFGAEQSHKQAPVCDLWLALLCINCNLRQVVTLLWPCSRAVSMAYSRPVCQVSMSSSTPGPCMMYPLGIGPREYPRSCLEATGKKATIPRETLGKSSANLHFTASDSATKAPDATAKPREQRLLFETGFAASKPMVR